MDAFPPLKALLAFDAAMRHHSFVKAGLELSVTPGAVGQQIQKLEAWLGTALFVRTVRQIAPTASAERYWADIAPALARISLASQALKDAQSDEVRLSMPPSLAAKWFARRMGKFMQRYPAIVLRLSASTVLADFDRSPAELAIRYFDGCAAGLDVRLMCRDDARLYCSRDYAARLGLAIPDDLQRATLLHSTMHPHWDAWLGAFATLTRGQIEAIPVQHVDLSLVAIDAARQGQGVVLSSRLLTEEEIESDALFEPFPCRLPLTHAFYVVNQKDVILHPAAQQVSEWLLSEGEALASID